MKPPYIALSLLCADDHDDVDEDVNRKVCFRILWDFFLLKIAKLFIYERMKMV